VADENPNQNESDAATTPGDDVPRSATEPRGIDMSDFEAQFTAGPPGVPSQRQPGLEWAVEWSDGRLTRVHSEAAARFVVERHPGCLVVCRIVGPWDRA
jgi:hypothetical protein